jgi:predicted permease
LVSEIATIVAPVLLIALVGFIWARSGAKFDTGMITSLVMLLGTPCLVVDTFVRVQPSPAAFAEMLAAGVSLFVGYAVVALVVLKLAGLPIRDYQGALMFPNMGNMGLPLSLFAFGDQGLALAIVLFALSAIGNFTIGTSIAAGTMDPRALARMPIIYAVALSLVIIVTGLHLPEWFENALHLVAGIPVPLMLVALGVSLSRLRARSLPRALFLSLVRLLGGFGIGLLVCWIFDLQDPARGVVMLQSCMPTAVFNYLFAERYGRDAPGVAGVVLISTLLSFVTLPLLLWYIL